MPNQKESKIDYLLNKCTTNIVSDNVLDQEKIEYFKKNYQHITYEDLQAIVERKKAA